MSEHSSFRSGRHFLQIPGPSNVPDRVLRAMAKPTMDHRSPAFAEMTRRVLEGLQAVFRTQGPVLLFPSSGTGAWEAALVNTLSPGDTVLAYETGHFATLWKKVAERLGLRVEWLEGDWRHGVDPDAVEGALRRDRKGRIRAVLAVHSETSTGVASRIPQIRAAMDAAGHPALLLVDTISSLGSMDYRHEEWGVDVTVCCSQKGLMLPPGLGMNAVSPRALEAAASAALPRSYWAWDPVLAMNERGFFPYTPPTNLLYGLEEALGMLLQEGLENVVRRHHRLAEATRIAVASWGLDLCCQNPDETSDSLTAVWMPDGHDADALRKLILERFDMSLGTGLGKVKGRVFRIGHLGDFNELMLAGTLCGVEMGLGLAGVPHRREGVSAALSYLASTSA
ncbi:MAG: pyridoxal-phosphate-dependent aminotransferase family protein [Longimicrobiales bacterium]